MDETAYKISEEETHIVGHLFQFICDLITYRKARETE